MNDRFKFRIWNPDLQSYDDNRDYNVAILVNQDFGLVLNPYRDNIIEMCTGLKDKNGNLIYEGDIVEITIFGSIGPNGGYVDSDEIYKGTVVWDWDCFLVKTDTDMILFPHSEDCIEIIGNVHEQAEQKDVK